MGEKKAADAYTEESYATYSENYDKILAAIDGAESVEAIEALNVAEKKTKNEELLVEKPTEEESSGIDGDSEEEEVDTEIGTEDEDSEETTGEVKLSEVSEEQLKKLFTAVTGQGVGDNKKWRKTMKRMRAKLQELGESLDPNDYEPEDFIIEDLQSETDAVKSLKDTANSLKSTAASMQNMTSAMREEYHKYANPAELAAMQEVEELVTQALINVYKEITAWGYEAEEVDSQSYMSQEDEATLWYHLVFENLDPDEVEDLADMLEMKLNNEVSGYKPVPEILGVSAAVALPDYDLAEEEDDDEGITRASIMFFITFARNLF